ncbi:MAG TPA: LuxR C-terminal-related transcriptional regulator [Streptosporangiales bacterium]
MTHTLTDPRLIVPPVPPRHVTRPRLLSQLDSTTDAPLLLLSAGPGFGKTVLLSDWALGHERAGQHGSAIVWLTVTPADDEPDRFWRLFLSAVRGRHETRGSPLSSVLGWGAAGLLESMSPPGAAPETPLVVIVDDAHVLSHPDILDGLDSIARGGFPQLRLVLSARFDPPLPLHRYRLTGGMRELRAADLAMTPEETRALLTAHGVTLPLDAFDLLVTRTEGWVAGIRLFALRMSGTEQPTDFVGEFALDRGSVGEYLIKEVLSQQPPAVRRLLIQTGFLDEVTGPLADAVTGLEGSAEVLTELARSNSFVIPLDPAQTRFRYHQLFAEILTHMSRQQAPRLVTSLYRRATDWYEAQGDRCGALRWAVAGADGLKAAALLARGGVAQAFAQRRELPESAPVLTLFDRIGDVDGLREAEIRTARLAIAAIGAPPGAADRHAELLPDDPELAVTAHLARLILAEKAGDGEVVDLTADRLLDAGMRRWLRAVPGLRAAVLLARARAHFWDGHFGDVPRLLEQARAAARSDQAGGVELDVLGMSALANVFGSRIRHADEVAREALALRRADDCLDSPLTLEIAAALRAFTASDLTEMTQAVRRAASASDIDWEPAAGVMLTIVRAIGHLACGQFSEAGIVLHDVPLLGGRGPLTLAAYRDMLLATTETALGRPLSALNLLRPYQNTGFAAPVEVPRARAYLALGEAGKAQDCIRRLVTGDTSTVSRHVLVEALLCDAEIAQEQDDAARAVELVTRACAIADRVIARPFLRTADRFAHLRARHPALAGQWPPATDTPGTVAVDARTMGTSPSPEELTDREHAVLRFLATGMSTAEIAGELCVSVNTVKTHLAAIYRKLGARGRREAVLRAREYEIL